ncbi:epidermal patterning factor-like protein 1 [Phtheirospermum japonicum]|uniref:Epidermal patterning factor-like protein n=1 Tax=Phtheirospermum japonicum TaxID=374723 RepID=A0A830B9K2_9LAMI|nr:epidermal patterning factor-like protein 1 [Phtheirospermum japonicum]
MSSLISSLNSTQIATVLFALFFFISSSYCLNHKQPLDTFRGFVVAAEKTRLGSTPPSCHNKCNQCHPCMAVQVPTLPSHNRLQPSSTAAGQEKPLGYFESPLASSSSAGNRYSNYKPLGWKCRCDGHFYNP